MFDLFSFDPVIVGFDKAPMLCAHYSSTSYYCFSQSPLCSCIERHPPSKSATWFTSRSVLLFFDWSFLLDFITVRCFCSRSTKFRFTLQMHHFTMVAHFSSSLLKFELLYENPVAINLQLPRFMHWKWKALMSAFRMDFKLVGSIDWSAQQVHSHLSLATSGSHWQGHLNKTLCKLLTGCPSRRFCTSEKEQSQFNRSSLGRCKCPYVQACVFVCVREDMYMCMHG